MIFKRINIIFPKNKILTIRLLDPYVLRLRPQRWLQCKAETAVERTLVGGKRLRAASVLVLRHGVAFGAVDNFEGEGLANQ
ncbi:hypothetical protein [Aeromonas caviae]|uniref:hypothetical protein n=1 Tax=Aeromonas caviae TaxID=648 RepID=UPI000A494265|nr:hypothetical protein [Aeromonas caviae]